jgi:signal transduction histidine kinase
MQSVVDHHRAKAPRTSPLERLFSARAVCVESEATDAESAPTRAARDFERLEKEAERWPLALAPQRLGKPEARDVPIIKAAHAVEPSDTARGQRGDSEMLAVVAHELRNALMPIRLSAAQLGRDRHDQVSLARLRLAIERQVDHMSRLVGDLLDTSRSSHGKLRIERVHVDLAEVVAEAADACRPHTETREQHLRIELPAKRATVDGDRVRLVQIVSNLLENASKYSPRGAKITVSAVLQKDFVELTVTDRGIGISAAVLPHVFETFVQDSHAVAFNGAGLGIGLSVVRELVQAHGGNVVARSAGRGLGSQFIVNLPLADGARTTNAVASGAGRSVRRSATCARA